MSSSASVHRPFGVGLLSILFMIIGVLEIIGGISVLVQANDNDFLRGIDVSSSDLKTYAAVGIIFGVIVLFVGSALRKGSNWARYLVGFIAAFRLFSLIWVVLAYHNVHWYNAFWPLAIYAFVAGYLFYDDDAVAYFEGK